MSGWVWGGGGYGGVGRGRLEYLSLHCHHQNDSCIKMGSDKSHNCEGQSHKTVSTLTTTRRAEADLNRGPSAYQPNALPLGQTGSLTSHCVLPPVLLPKKTSTKPDSALRLVVRFCCGEKMSRATTPTPSRRISQHFNKRAAARFVQSFHAASQIHKWYERLLGSGKLCSQT